MNRRELMRLVDEGVAIVESLSGGELSRRDEMKAVDRMLEVIDLLGGDSGGNTEPQPAPTNPLYQSVLDGEPVTEQLIEQVKAEGQKDLDHPQLRPVVRVIVEAVRGMAA